MPIALFDNAKENFLQIQPSSGLIRGAYTGVSSVVVHKLLSDIVCYLFIYSDITVQKKAIVRRNSTLFYGLFEEYQGKRAWIKLSNKYE